MSGERMKGALMAALLAVPCAAQAQASKPAPMTMPMPGGSKMDMPKPETAKPAKPTMDMSKPEISQPESPKMDMPKPMPSIEAAPIAPAVPQQEAPKEAGTVTLPSLAERSGWPSPTADSETYGFLLFDNFELQNGKGPGALRWDVLGWRGGDVHRFWFKSEGRQLNSSKPGSEYEVQALYGKLIAPFFDLQAGIRLDQRVERNAKPARAYAVLGLQGLAPYRFDVEPTLFLSQKGKLSGRFTGTYDFLLSQRLILQPRVEANFAAQKDEEIGIGAGLNDTEVGFRLRYEIRREFAPYLGVTWQKSFGATRQLALREGGEPNRFLFVMGVRVWF